MNKLLKMILAIFAGAIVILVYHASGEASALGLVGYYIIVTPKLE